MVAAFWGVFIWREFKNAAPGTNRLLALMFALFIVGLGLIVYANDKAKRSAVQTALCTQRTKLSESALQANVDILVH
jgi:hypothetical protein